MSHFVRHDTIKSLFDGDKAEILRFAQDDQNTVGWEGGLLPIMCHPERSEGSPPYIEEVH